MWWIWVACAGTWVSWELAHLMMTGFADKNLAWEIAHAGHAGEGATPVETKTSHATSVTARVSSCRHVGAVPVDNVIPENEGGLGRLAWWCPDCDTQLPASFTPPIPVPDVDLAELRRMTVADYANSDVVKAFKQDAGIFSW